VKATGLYEVKPWFVRRLTWIEDGLVRLRIHPNTLTAVGSWPARESGLH